MTEPEFVEIDGHRLAIPPGHPAFARDGYESIMYATRWDVYDNTMVLVPGYRKSIGILDGGEKRQCAAEAFAYWMLRPNADRVNGNWALMDEYYKYAVAWEKWGGLDKIAEGKR